MSNKIRISETEFATAVEDLLNLYHWRWTHSRPAWSNKGWRTPIKGDKGFPDYCAVRPPRLLFIELKDQYSKLSLEQEAWLNDLRQCPTVECYLWRPDQWEEVVTTLK